jgi:hypothetical protein
MIYAVEEYRAFFIVIVIESAFSTSVYNKKFVFNYKYDLFISVFTL